MNTTKEKAYRYAAERFVYTATVEQRAVPIVETIENLWQLRESLKPEALLATLLGIQSILQEKIEQLTEEK